MREPATRTALTLLALAGVWVAVYWFWPARPKITLARESPILISQPARDTARPMLKAVSEPAEVDAEADESQTGPPSGVVEPQFISHTVLKGETLASIAKRYFGSEQDAGVIAAANPLMSPSDLTPGRVIRIPQDPDNIQGKAIEPAQDTSTPEYWTVQPGDTLGTISQRAYGTVRHSQLIFDANKDQMRSPDKLKVGMRLKLPPKPKEAAKENKKN